MLVTRDGEGRIDEEEEAGQRGKGADPEGQEGACAGWVGGVEQSAAEGGDEGVRWIGDGGDVLEGRWKNLLLIRKQNGRHVRSRCRFISPMLSAT